jgi:hypothetical protein
MLFCTISVGIIFMFSKYEEHQRVIKISERNDSALYKI